MSASVSKSFHISSPLKIDEDNSIGKKGIITILGSDFQSSKAAATSIRRTLSADMSSNNWLSQNGFINPIKKIASFAQLCTNNASSLGDDHQESKGKGQDEIWASIQSEKNELKSRSWGSIMLEDNKDQGSTNLPPPYIHPLVKRTTSSLSEKSLQICTESLGTETGSDVNEDQEDETVKINNVQEVTQVAQQQQQKDSFEEVHVVKYSYSCAKKLSPKSFPPPLPSLAKQDGASLQMQSHRQNGRLVLEAVSVPTKNRFHAQREHGRLLLTLIDDHSRVEETKDDEEVVQEFDQVFDGINDEVEIMKVKSESETESESDDEEEENKGFVINQTTKLPSGIITMPKGAFMMNKFMGLDNKNLTWSPKLINNAHVKLIEVEDEEEEEEMVVGKNKLTPIPQSLPPPPRVARLISSSRVSPTANSFNAYEYFWKEKPTMTNIVTRSVRNDCNHNEIKNNNKVIMKSNLMGYEQQNLVLMKGDKGDYLVPFLSRCTEPKRSLLYWDSYCIATS